MDRRMDKQRCEGEKGRETLNQCFAPPEEGEQRQKEALPLPTSLVYSINLSLS